MSEAVSRFGHLLPLIYLLVHNFDETPVVDGPPYNYSAEEDRDLHMANA